MKREAQEQNEPVFVTPAESTRVEYQVRRPWLKRYAIDTVEQVLRRLPDIVVKLTAFGPHPLFVLLAGDVDRGNHNQSR